MKWQVYILSILCVPLWKTTHLNTNTQPVLPNILQMSCHSLWLAIKIAFQTSSKGRETSIWSYQIEKKQLFLTVPQMSRSPFLIGWDQITLFSLIFSRTCPFGEIELVCLLASKPKLKPWMTWSVGQLRSWYRWIILFTKSKQLVGCQFSSGNTNKRCYDIWSSHSIEHEVSKKQ